MNLRVLPAVVIAMAISTDAVAEHFGVPQRDYFGRTYLIYPGHYRGPVWYAGNGKVEYGSASSRLHSHFNAVPDLVPCACKY